MFITMTAPSDRSQQLLVFVLSLSENLMLAARGKGVRSQRSKARRLLQGK